MNKIFHTICLSALTGLILTSTSCTKKETAQGIRLMNVDVTYPIVDSVMLRKNIPGFLTANNEVDLVARVDGVLLSHPYNPGERVRKGAVLFQIDGSTYRNQVEQAKASLENARASYDYSSRQYEAMKIAIQSDAVSEMEVLQAKSAMDEAAAQIKNYEAALKNAETTLGYCTVTAPFDGRVSVTNFDTGNYLSGGASPVVLATIYDDATVYANIEIDNDTYLSLVNNMSENLNLNKIPVYFDEQLPHTYYASLDYIAPDLDKSTGTIMLRGKIENPYGELKSGMYVSVAVPYGHLDKAILIEDAAIGTDQLGKYVYVVNDSNQIIYTPIEAGEVIDQTKRVVTKGLSPESRYVTKALLKVKNGEKVNPIEKN